MPTFSVYLSEDVANEVKKAAERLGISTIELMRRRIDISQTDKTVDFLSQKVEALLQLMEYSTLVTGYTAGATRASISDSKELVAEAEAFESATKKAIRQIKKQHNIDEQ